MDPDRTKDANPQPAKRRPWAAPKLIEYGHIGKLTQGSSGSRSETGGRKPCL